MSLMNAGQNVRDHQRVRERFAWDRLGPLRKGDRVMVQASRGHQYGAVVSEDRFEPGSFENTSPLAPYVRVHEIDPRYWLDEHKRAPQATPIDVSVTSVFRAGAAE